MFAALAGITLVACDKDDDDDNSTPNSQLIVGTWQSTSFVATFQDSSVTDTLFDFGNTATANFTAQGTYTFSADGGSAASAGTYAISGSELTLYSFDTTSYNLTTLNATNMAWDGMNTVDMGAEIDVRTVASFTKQ